MKLFKSKSLYEKVMLLLGILMLFSEIWKQYLLTMKVNGGAYQVWYFPFQLCSLPMYLCILLCWAPAVWKERIQVFLMTFSLLGGMVAFVDTTGMHYSLAVLTVHSYLWHVLVIVIGLWSGFDWCRRKKQNIQGILFPGFFACLPIWLISLGIATVLNVCLWPLGEINMFYISPMEISYQKIVHELAMRIGIHGSNLLYLLAMLAGAGMLYYCWTCGRRVYGKDCENNLASSKTDRRGK